MHIHGHFKNNDQETILTVSNYLFQNTLPWLGPGLLRKNDGCGRLFLAYTDWAVAGSAEDSVELPLSDIERVVEPCQILSEGEHESLLATPIRQDTIDPRTFTVEYGISKSQVNSIVTIEVRKLRDCVIPRESRSAVEDVSLKIDIDDTSEMDATVSYQVYSLNTIANSP